MKKINWDLLEQWATAKWRKFGGEDLLDLVMLCVGRRADEMNEREFDRLINSK